MTDYQRDKAKLKRVAKSLEEILESGELDNMMLRTGESLEEALAIIEEVLEELE